MCVWYWLSIKLKIIIKRVDMPGIEPGAFRMQSERDTTTPHTHVSIPTHSIPLLLDWRH